MKTKFIGILASAILFLSMLTLALNIQPVISDPGTIRYVPSLNYPTIQAAINAANPGDEIMVSPGTYPEAININKTLSVIGSGAATTIINGSGVTLSNAGLVKITAPGNVEFSNFTVCDAPGDPSDIHITVLSESSVSGVTYTISQCRIYGTFDPNEAQDYGFYAQSGKENIVFTNNTITGTGANNMVEELHTGSSLIEYNNFDAGVWGTDCIFFMTYNGVDVTTVQNVSHNTFNMGTGGPFDLDHRATGVSFCAPGAAWGIGDAKFTNMVVSGNVFNNLQDNRRAIGFWNSNDTVNNLIGAMITHNTVNGVVGSTNSSGIDFYGLTMNTQIMYNTITGTDKAIVLREGDAPGTIIHYNNIAGNTVGVDWSLGSSPVDARFNWWGVGTGPSNSVLNPQGLGDKLVNAVFEPWLTETYPPASPVTTLLYVNPAIVNYWTVSYGKSFTAYVNVANVANLYGFDFNLTWNPSLLYLVSIHDTIPWSNPPFTENITNQIGGVYRLAAAGTSAFAGNTTFAALTFKIIYDPICPANATCTLGLTNAQLAGYNGAIIYHMEHNGQYNIYSTLPTIQVTPLVTANAINQIFMINVTGSNFVNLYYYSFQLSYNTTLLDVTSIQTGTFLKNQSANVTLNDSNGLVILTAWSQGGAAPTNGSGLLATITFKVTLGSLARVDIHGNIIPNVLACAFHLHNIVLKTNMNVQVPSGTSDGVYNYKPKLGDLNYDGKVNFNDLTIVAHYYESRNYPIADINQDGIVNIYDVAVVTSNYGK